MEDDKLWKGVHVSQLQTSLNLPQYPRMVAGDEHTVLIKTPVAPGNIPECYPSILKKRDFWDLNHVKLPSSEKNVTKDQINRWNLIRDALNKRILSSQQLQAAILSYNKRYAEQWNFSALHSFFSEVFEEPESQFFFDSLLSKIVELALSLPELITGGIPLLKRGHRHSVTLSQLQISCLLSNAFLCTFPHRNTTRKNSEYFDYPDINFNRLFHCENEDRIKTVHEKLKCILNYFRRVINSMPTGVVTYSRQFVPNNIYPNWSKSIKKLTRLYVSSMGTIEDDGFGLFQVDFANKFVGGGVIGTGCVQEEIRFVICPELILSRLFTQCLGENEALVVTGCERFNKYKGYGSSFEWDGDYVDGTPSDEDGRKYCTVIALDALYYRRNPFDQYLSKNMLRDMNKAYVGFSWGSRVKKEELCAVATGNWGCGIFRGNPQLKSILQLMAAAEVGRDLAYFTFGDTELRDSMASIHKFLCDNEVTVGKLYKFLIEYNAKQLYKTVDLFEFFKTEANKEISNVEVECDRPQSNVRNSFGMPKLDITKRSFCCRTKMNDWLSPMSKSGSDLWNMEKEKVKVNDSVEKELKLQETLTLANLYQSPFDSLSTKSDQQHGEQNCFDFLNKFKKSLKRTDAHTYKKTMVNSDVEFKVENKNISLQEDAENEDKIMIENGDDAKNITLNSKNECIRPITESDVIEGAANCSRMENRHFQLIDERKSSNEVDRVAVNDHHILTNNIHLDLIEVDRHVGSTKENSVCNSSNTENTIFQTNINLVDEGRAQTNHFVVSSVGEDSNFILKKLEKENVYEDDNSKYKELTQKNFKSFTGLSTNNSPSGVKNSSFSSKSILNHSINVKSSGNNSFSKKRKISDYFNQTNKKLDYESRNSL